MLFCIYFLCIAQIYMPHCLAAHALVCRLPPIANKSAVEDSKFVAKSGGYKPSGKYMHIYSHGQRFPCGLLFMLAFERLLLELLSPA